MSYDLFLIPKADDPFGAAEFDAFFHGRLHYTFTDTQAFYENARTGVYFSFDWIAGDGSAPDTEDVLPTPHMAFNINYCRPDVFGVEAVMEMNAVIAAFNPNIYDPQMSGMDRGPYTSDGFLQGWRAGNMFGHGVFKRDGHAPDAALPAHRNRLMWEWNFGRDALSYAAEAMGEDIFVPGIFPYSLEGSDEVLLGAVWSDAIRVLMPEGLDVYILYDSRPAPAKKLFGLFGGKPGPAPGPIGAVPADLVRVPGHEGTVTLLSDTYRTIEGDAENPHPDVDAVFKTLGRRAKPLRVQYRADSVVDAETLAAALQSDQT